MTHIFLDEALALLKEINLPNSKFVAISNFYFVKFLVYHIIGNKVLPIKIYQCLVYNNINIQNDKKYTGICFFATFLYR